jgi:hypothetical protein
MFWKASIERMQLRRVWKLPFPLLFLAVHRTERFPCIQTQQAIHPAHPTNLFAASDIMASRGADVVPFSEARWKMPGYTGYVRGLAETCGKTPVAAQSKTISPSPREFLYTRTMEPKSDPRTDPCNSSDIYKPSPRTVNLWPDQQSKGGGHRCTFVKVFLFMHNDGCALYCMLQLLTAEQWCLISIFKPCLRMAS